MKEKSTEAVRRWRAAHPERNREQANRASAKYAGTAKGMLAKARYDARRRGA